MGAVRVDVPRSRLHLPDLHIPANLALVLGCALLFCLALVGAVGPALTPLRPEQGAFVGPLDHLLISHPPSWTIWMGTNIHAQDVFTLWVYGGRMTLEVGFGAGAASLLVALVVGLSAGYLGGVIDDVANFATNLFLIVPPLPALLVLLVGSSSPPSRAKLILLLALATWAPGARIIRSQMLSVRTRDFVLAAITCGEPRWRIIAVEILPHLSSLVLYLLVNTVLLTTVAEFNLEFLGLIGANGNIVETYGWGNLLWNASFDGEFVAGDWWVWGFPALGIAVSVVALVLLSVGLDRLRHMRYAAGL